MDGGTNLGMDGQTKLNIEISKPHINSRMSTITFGYQIVIAMLFPCSNHEISIVYPYLDIVGLLELLPLRLVHLRANDKFYLYSSMKSSENSSNHPSTCCYRPTTLIS